MPEPITIAAAGVAAGAIGNAYLSDKFDGDDTKIIALLEENNRLLNTINEAPRFEFIQGATDGAGADDANRIVSFTPTSDFQLERITIFNDVAGLWKLINGSTPNIIRLGADAITTVEFPLFILGGNTVFLSQASAAISATPRMYLIGRYVRR